MAEATHLPQGWARRLLVVLAAPATRGNLELLAGWAKAEGGTASFNPLNTTFNLAGSTAYNSAGVRNYLDGVQGICATALTLRLGLYSGIVTDLRAGTFLADQIVRRRAHEFDTWGTGSGNLLRALRGV